MFDLPATLLRAYYILNLMRDQWRGRRRLQNIQLKGLKGIVRHAYNHVPYYHRLFRSAKFRPEDLRALDDVRRIPITTKIDLQRNYPLTLAAGTDPSRQEVSFTTGSTGVPLKILFNRQASIYSNALVQYAFLECGVSLRDRFVTITRDTKSIKRRKVYQNVAGVYFNEILVPKGEIEWLIRVLREIKPDVIYTTPPYIIEIAKKRGAAEINPRKIFSNGSNILPHDRDLVRQVFGVEINDTYGSHEFHRLAFECNEHSGFHMITDCALIEFLEDGEPVAPGEKGEIVVTGFYNRTMPFIRYRLGDVGIPSEETCGCGRSWPLIKRIEGRTNEYLLLPSGRKIAQGQIFGIVSGEIRENVWCISQIQVVQEKRDRIALKIVKGREFDPNVIEKIRQKLEALCAGDDVTVYVNFVDEIPIERTGKRRYIIPLQEEPYSKGSVTPPPP